MCQNLTTLSKRSLKLCVYFCQIGAFLKAKGSLEEVEAALTSAPIAVPGLHRLVEGVKLGRAWIANVVSMGLDQRSIDLKSLEALVAEGQRLAVALPHLKVCLFPIT